MLREWMDLRGITTEELVKLTKQIDHTGRGVCARTIKNAKTGAANLTLRASMLLVHASRRKPARKGRRQITVGYDLLYRLEDV